MMINNCDLISADSEQMYLLLIHNIKKIHNI